MCGVAGVVQRTPLAEGLLGEMTDRLAHRGPDGSGTWLGTWNGWHVALGHRRLAIIDPAGGRQPMGNEDGSLQLAFNGEVYGHQQLRAELSALGHRFRTRSDTEAVLHKLEQSADDTPASLASLDGMFALALWDQSRGRLLLARDRVGIKPLFYAALPCGGVAFASELTALLAHPSIDRAIDPDSLMSYLFMDYCMAPGCMVRGVRKLEPATYLLWENGVLSEPRPYWRLGARPQRAPADRRARVEHLRRLLEVSVQTRLVADVPVGLFLSGGLDSSVVGALAVKHRPGGLKTFSVRMDDADFDQSSDARLVAAHIGSQHIEVHVSASSMLSTLDQALGCLDEPMADPSLLPTFALSRLASRHVKVVLSGDGADELWGGYPTLRAHALARGYGALPQVVRRRLIEPVVRRLPVHHGYQGLEWKAKRFVMRWDDDPPTRHLRWMSSLDLDGLAHGTGRGSTLPQGFRGCSTWHGSGDLLNDILRLDFSTYLPGAVLTKVDRASMAHGLEVRPPLLSNDLIDYAFSLPSSVKARGTRTKILLKQAAQGLLPKYVLRRPKKGFAVPLARWLIGPLSDRLDAALGPGPVWDHGLLDRGVFLRWRDEHRRMSVDHARPLWAIIVLDHWLRRARVVPAVADAMIVAQ